MAKGPYKLKLTKLQWLSSVDAPAQGDGAKALLIKRKGEHDEIALTAKISKLNDDLGLVYGHAFAASLDGGTTPHVDYQEDAIDPDFVKTAMEFMEDGGPTDVNHDCEADGRIVFAWPLIPEVNEALGIKSDVIGLAIAVKPSPETYAKFKSGELTGFSLYGTGVRSPLAKGKAPVVLKAAPARVQKASLYTNEVDGHQHKVCVYEDGSLYVEWATMEGADQGHSHGIVFESGALTILADSGHTHELAEGQPGIVAVPADAIVVIAASASKSTRPIGMPQPGSTTEGTMSNTPDLSKQLLDLTKQLEHANKLATLTDAQRAYHKGKRGADAESFLNKSHDEREALLDAVEKTNPVVYTSKAGRVFRKSDEPSGIVAMAKQLDDQADALAKRDEAIEKAEIRKLQSETFKGVVPGDNDTLDFIIGACRKNEKAMESLRGLVAASTLGKKAPGVGGTDATSGDPLEEFNGAVKAFATTKSIKDEGEALEKFLMTTEGQVAKRKYDATRGYGKHLA